MIQHLKSSITVFFQYVFANSDSFSTLSLILYKKWKKNCSFKNFGRNSKTLEKSMTILVLVYTVLTSSDIKNFLNILQLKVIFINIVVFRLIKNSKILDNLLNLNSYKKLCSFLLI